jgi:hypothetical protein
MAMNGWHITYKPSVPREYMQYLLYFIHLSFIHPSISSSFYHTYSSDVSMGMMIIHQSTPYIYSSSSSSSSSSTPYPYLSSSHIILYKGRVSEGFDRSISGWMYLHHHHQLKSFLSFFHVIHDANRHLYAVLT